MSEERDEASIGPDLAAWDRAIRIETRGRRTGGTATAYVSFHEEADGSLLVAAAGPSADWAKNLAADPVLTVVRGERRYEAIAERLDGPDYATAIRELILKGGTPAERLGHGPAFRLRRVAGVA